MSWYNTTIAFKFLVLIWCLCLDKSRRLEENRSICMFEHVRICVKQLIKAYENTDGKHVMCRRVCIIMQARVRTYRRRFDPAKV